MAELKELAKELRDRLDAIDSLTKTLVQQEEYRGLTLAGGARIRLRQREAIDPSGTIVHLHPAEWKVLSMLAQKPGDVVTYARFGKVWNSPYGPEAALRVAVTRIRKVLGYESVVVVQKTGYKLGVRR